MREDIKKIAAAVIEAHQGPAVTYYDQAEGFMDEQWESLVRPFLTNFNFTVTLDFAAGHGRNSVHLVKLAQQLYIADANAEAVSYLRKRFAGYDPQRCSIHVIHNSGYDLRDVPTGAITALYSFDSIVHFEKRLIEAYMPEFRRVMAPGAYGFIHHSNFGRISQDPDFHNHPAWRSNVDKDWFAQCCFRHRLLVVRQTVMAWWAGEVAVEDLDCVSIIYKPLQWVAV